MNLALFGSGEFTPAVNNIDKYLISKYKPKNIAVLPTAAGLERGVTKWTDMAKQHYAKLNLPVISIPIFNKVQANDPKLTDPLTQADWIFFSGGNPGYLLATLRNSKLWKIVLKRLDDGALLAGSSAGAMIMGKFLLAPSFKALFNDNEVFWQRAFGLIDYSVFPHFDHFKKQKDFMRKVIEHIPDKVSSAWMGIDENTAIVFNKHECTVHGLGGVEIHNSTGIQRLKA